MSSAPDPPPAPNYAAAASATAAGNRDNSIAAQQGSMVNQYTPYGNLNYSRAENSPEGNPTYNATYNLTPEAQRTLTSQMGLSNNMADLATSATGRTNQAYSNPMDMSSVNDVADKSYAAQTSRLDPQWNQRQTQTDTQLRNQGLTPGTEAYDNAMRDFSSSRNDAYTQARQQAINTMPQTYQLANSIREQPLNELNAIRTGAQVQNPNFQTQPGQQYTPGPDMLGAAGMQNQYNMGLYNSQVGQQNSFMNGLAGLAGTAGMMAFSDIRLKSKVKRLGRHARGFGIYAYEIFGQSQTGVMAQEVMHILPEAVMRHPSGYLMVDYGQL